MNTLSEFFNNNTIPEIKDKPLTFLGIAKQPHYENVWSNIYAFFFDVNGEHGFENLFINSLLTVIKNKLGQAFKFDGSFNIQTEVPTDCKGRIDLLLYNSNQAVIIENKVCHYLNNALDDYWNSTKQKHKLGIVLSLKPILKISHSGFINITHFELLTEVMRNFGFFMANASDKYTIFLKDFYQNIINLSDPMEKQQIDFFCQHASQIHKAVTLNETVVSHIDEEVKKACEQLNLNFFKVKRTHEGYHYYESKKNRNLMLTVYFADILEGNFKLLVMVELQNDLIKEKRLELRELILDKEENQLQKEEFFTGNDNWAHFAVAEFEVKPEQLHSFSNFIVSSITNSPIKSIFNKVESFLFN